MSESERLRRKTEVALGYRIFASLRWGDLGDGHITARDPERTDCMWLLRFDVSFDQATTSDLMLVGPDGSVVEGDGPINTTAYFIHHPIHVARPDAVAVAHTHTPWGTPFAAEARPLQPISQEACVFYNDHALFDDEEVQILGRSGGERIAQALGQNRAAILRNHGLLTVGSSVAESIAAFVTLERVAEVHMKAAAAKPISPAAAETAKADLAEDRSLETAFEFLVKRHVGDRSVVQG